jgi:tight adherence protein C
MTPDLSLYLGAGVSVAGGILLLSALLSQQTRRSLGGASTDMRQVALRQRAGKRIVSPLMGHIAQLFHRLTPTGAVERLDKKIDVAGARQTWSADRLIGTKVMLATAGAIVGVYRVINDPTPMTMLVAVMLSAGCFGLPDFVLARRAKERKAHIDRELPDLLDQMVVSVEAGLGFEAAMSRVAKSNDGALAHELSRVLQDVRFGMNRRDAFAKLLGRTDSTDLKQFVNALTQAERLGMPLADVLRVQADEMRKKRRMRAEETALKIPVKLVFPLLFCIMPALFVVIIGPAVIRIADSGL